MSTKLRTDRREYEARRFATSILNMLYNYIPHALHSEVSSRLMEASMDQGFELTSYCMREQYEALQRLTLEQANPVFIVPV